MQYKALAEQYKHVPDRDFMLAMTLAKLDAIHTWLADHAHPVKTPQAYEDYHQNQKKMHNFLGFYLNWLHPVPPPHG